MPEKTSVIVNRAVGFEGLFSVAEFVQLVDDYFEKRGYGKGINVNVETVKPTGKFIKLSHTYKRFINEYARYEIDTVFNFENITTVDIVKGGVKTKMNKGKAKIAVDSWVITDYEKSWEVKPIYYFLRTLMNKFFFKNIHSQWESDVKSDVTDLFTEVGSYFNLQQYTK